MKPEKNTYFQQKRFNRISRQISGRERRGQEVPAEMIEVHKNIDYYLAMNYPKWSPHYKHK